VTQFEAKTTDEGGLVRVALAGECDLAVSARLDEVLAAALDRGPLVVVDLAGLMFLDSSGVHGLITAHHAAQRKGSRVVAVNARGAVAKVLELTGVDRLLGPPPSSDGAAKHRAAQDGAAQDRAAQDGAAQDGAAPDGAAQDRAARDGGTVAHDRAEG
jgi:anti-sigma B factor antagonist